MDQILVGTRAPISATFYSGETATDSTTAVTVEVLREDGTVLVPAGTATVDSQSGDGKYEYVLTPAHTGVVDILRARWSATINGLAQTLTTYHEIVGGFYFTLPELRRQPGLSDSTRFSLNDLAEARFWITDVIDRVCTVPFVPRYDRIVLDGSGLSSLMLPKPYVQQILGVSVGGTAYSTADVTALVIYPEGIIKRPSGVFTAGDRNVSIRYSHGYRHGDGEAPPFDLRAAALRAARTYLLGIKNSDLFDRATSITNEFGNIALALPGENRPTGIPEVDAVILGWRDRVRVPVVA